MQNSLPNPMRPPPPILAVGGNYRDLLSCRKAEVIYDFTHHFCHLFLKKSDRTIDQMVQAALAEKPAVSV